MKFLIPFSTFLLVTLAQASKNINFNEEAPQDLSDFSIRAKEGKEDGITADLADPLATYKYGSDNFRFGPNLKVEKAFNGDFPISVAVSKRGRKFVSFPHWEQNKGKSLVEIVNGKEVLYPNESMNNVQASFAFTNIHALFIDDYDRLWVLDTGAVTNKVRPVTQTRFFVYNLKTNCLNRIYTFPKEVQLPGSQLQDIRFDSDMKFGFITDASVPGIVVLDLESGKSFRRLDNHNSTTALDNFSLVIEGNFVKPNGKSPKIHSNGIAISKDRKTLYYAPVSSRKLYSVPVASLSDCNLSNQEVEKQVQVVIDDKGSATAGLITDDVGNIFLANLEHNSITRFDPRTKSHELVVRHPALLWPDTLSFYNNRIYVTANQMHRRAAFNGGVDARQEPYFLFSFPV